jgi:hypothetical protein
MRKAFPEHRMHVTVNLTVRMILVEQKALYGPLPLDTLVLAMPISWKGALQQYAGRPHREHATKTDVRIIDFVDTGHPTLLKMWEKRQRGYREWRIGSRSDAQQIRSTTRRCFSLGRALTAFDRRIWHLGLIG